MIDMYLQYLFQLMSETDDVSSSAYAQHLYHLVAYARYNVYQYVMYHQTPMSSYRGVPQIKINDISPKRTSI